MNISQENNGDLTAIIQINLKEEDYIESVNKQLSDYRKKANVPGFRPGKVPMGMIKKMYGKGVRVEEVNKAVSEALNNYILEKNLNVLGYPLPNMEKTTTIDFDNQNEFDFFFDIGLSPEFEIDISENINVPYYSIKIGDEEIDKAINDIKVRFGNEENPEVAEESDALQGKFREVDENGDVVEGGKEHAGYFRIEDVKLKTIQKKFIGAKAEDKLVFNLMKAFKNEDKVKSLLHIHDGEEDKLELDYQFEIEKVVRTEEAEVNEELFKKVYPNEEITSEEAFRERLVVDLKQHHARDTDQQFLADSINELMGQANIELPDEFMKRWLLESNQGKITTEQLDEQYDSYKKTMKWQLIDAKLQEKHGEVLKVDQEAIRNKVRAYFQPGGEGGEISPQIEQIVDQVLSNQEETERIYRGLMDENYVKLFKEHFKIKEKEVDSEKFFEIASNTK